MKCRLTRLESNHQNLRTDSAEGQTDLAPTVGEIFVLAGEPLSTEGNIRVIHTTPIERVENFDGYVEFWTKNSHYKFENLEN
jgi:hypothetical protein